MASAPPLETAGPMENPQPPSYAETMSYPSPQHLQQGPVPPPPVYTKAAQPPYPTQAYTQMYPQQTHSPPVTNSIVSVQTIYVQPGVVYGDVPVQTYCPVCAQSVVTRLGHTAGTMAWLTCAGLFIFGCVYGCCLIPFCVDGLKDVTHQCPNCSNVLGVYKRL